MNSNPEYVHLNNITIKPETLWALRASDHILVKNIITQLFQEGSQPEGGQELEHTDLQSIKHKSNIIDSYHKLKKKKRTKRLAIPFS